MPKKSSIRVKLEAFFFFVAFVVMLGLVGAQQFYSYFEFKKYIERNAIMAVRASVYIADRWFLDKMKSMQFLAYGLERKLPASTDIEKDFKEEARILSMEGVVLGLEDGQFFTNRVGASTNLNFKQSGWYLEALEAKTTGFMPPVLNPVTGKATVTFTAPIFDENRWLVKGVVAYEVPLEEIHSALSTVFITEVDAVEFFKMQSGGVGILVRPKDMPHEDLEMIRSQSSFGSFPKDALVKFGKNQYMLIQEKLSQAGIPVVYPVALTQLVAPLLYQGLFLFLIVVVGLWVVLKVTWFVVASFIRRIEELDQATEKIGRGDFSVMLKPNSNDEIGRLAESFNRMAVSLKDYTRKLEITVREKEQIAKELELASTLQQSALPREVPRFQGLEIAARSFPAKYVGGDYYDFIYPDDENVGFIIADAAGKGFPGSLYMSNSRSVFRVVSKMENSPAKLLKDINDYLSQELPGSEGMFITYVYGVYNKATHSMTYSNAGHFPPLFYKAKSKTFEPLKSCGMPIGIMPGETYTEETISFEKGDILVMYTDGAIEAVNQKSEMFGLEKLREIIEKDPNLAAAVLLDKIGDEIQRFVGDTPQHDDITVVVVRSVEH
jgi:sigma-B regulation protein RsbU (phosphoserine phosphatase)